MQKIVDPKAAFSLQAILDLSSFNLNSKCIHKMSSELAPNEKADFFSFVKALLPVLNPKEQGKEKNNVKHNDRVVMSVRGPLRNRLLRSVAEIHRLCLHPPFPTVRVCPSH